MSDDDLDLLLSSARARRTPVEPVQPAQAPNPAEPVAAETTPLNGSTKTAGINAGNDTSVTTGLDHHFDGDIAARRRRWMRGLSLVLGCVAFAGVLTDAVAATQLLKGAGAWAFAIVWPLCGLGLLGGASLQARFVDRFARVKVLRWLLGTYSLLFAGVLLLVVLDVPASWPAAVSWLLADQMNLLVPLVVWALAGDVFTAGEAVTLYPRISRFTYVGQFTGLSVATGVALWWHDAGSNLIWLIALSPLMCITAAITAGRSLRDTSSAERIVESPRGEAWRSTISFVRGLPSFVWLVGVSGAVLLAGTTLEFAFFELSADRIPSASRLQAVYAGATLVGFALCWLVQVTLSSRLMRTLGVQRVLMVLPVATVLAGAVMWFAAVGSSVALAVAALLVWRLPRWSVDTSARQSAMALLPDERRARASFLVDLVPMAGALVLSAVPICLLLVSGQRWVLGLIATVLAALACALGSQVIAHWETTQLNYRLKRRKRLN